MTKSKSQTRVPPTISAMQHDEITEIAAKYWAPFTDHHEAYNPQIIEDMYNDELLKEGFVKRKIVLLEFSQYLEAYLWPNFTDKSTDAHVLSIVVMLNEKFRERVPAWAALINKPDLFPLFFSKVLALSLKEEEISFVEQTAILTFLVNAVNSVEVDLVRKEIVKISSLNALVNLFPSQRIALLSKSPKLLKYWNKLESKFSELPEDQQRSTDFNRTALWKLIQKFLKTLAFVDDETTPFDPEAVKYLERFLEFAIDMISLLATRRFFNQLIIYSHLLVKAAQSDFIKTEFGALFCKLIMRLKFYVRFEIDDVNGMALTENEMIQKHYDHVVELQKAAFKFFRERMASFYLLSASSIDTPKVLSQQLSELNEDDLYNFAEYLHLVPTTEEKEKFNWNESYSKQFLIDVVVFHCERRPNQLQQLNEQPIFPGEKTIWDEDLVPYDEYDGDNVLALPKLNFQFLTLHDYLLRNFLLFQMESTYEIRHDIETTLFRMRPWQHEHGNDKIVWGGWARYALPTTEFRFVQISKPLIGQRAPADVTADLTITLPNRKDLRQEWENLHRHDVLFLVTVVPLLPVGTKFNPRKPFSEQIRVTAVRGCEIDGLIDNDGKVVEEMEHRDVLRTLTGDIRKYRIWLDPNQYFIDQQNDDLDVYYTLNLVIRRDPKTNNFKAVLSTIRQLLNTDFVVPDWLQDLILGYGDPDSAHYSKLASPISTIDFNDTFLSVEHLKSSFPGCKITGLEKAKGLKDPGFKLTFMDLVPQHNLEEGERDDSVVVEPYERYSKVMELAGDRRRNMINFTPTQVEAIKSGTEPGLTVVVGPPGTGKTDVAVQIISNIYHNWPEQRTLIVTHSNQALNQLFEKIIALNVDERHLLRLGHGEESLETEKDFSRYGRVNYVLSHRIELLRKVEKLRDSLGEVGDVGYSCETAGQFYRFIICRLWDEFIEAIEKDKSQVAEKFPFKKYFEVEGEELFKGDDGDYEIALSCWKILVDLFGELEEFRSFELLRNGRDRTEYLLVKEAKIIAMTCTHAALRRKDLVNLGFRYDNILMEEAAQILEVETFIPLLLQDPNDGRNRLKRWIMIGDHHQLPPIVQNVTFQKYSNMEQSLFARFVRLGVPHIQLDAQGRARPEIAALYNWRYLNLNDLDHVKQREYCSQNPGFVFNYQLIDIPDFNGVGESTPSPFFYQNLGEAEYAASLFIYMRVLGYPAEKISILTTYNGQVSLIQDVIDKKCGNNPVIGKPHKIATVDRFQGQQNDYIILSLVRTNHVGHLRDVRRLVVALSRARLGLYILARVNLFKNCFELTPAFSQLCRRSTVLELLPNELFGTKRLPEDALPMKQPVKIVDTDHMMSLSRLALGSLRLRSSLLTKQLPIVAVTPSYRNTTTAAVAQGKPMGAHALHFKVERYFAAAMLPLIPASYFIHGTTMDMLLTVALTLHIHWGFVAVVNDYARPIVVGPTVAKLAIPFAYACSALLLAGLIHFNTNDVGITRAFEMIFSL